MAVGQLCVVVGGFSLGVAQGYVDYGRWPTCVLLLVGFPWALPKAMLTMAVGQLWFVVGVFFPGRCPRLC